MKFFSASACLIASLACVASSSSSDAPGGNCRRKLPDATKHDIDDFLGIPHYPDFQTTLSGAAPDWPMEAYDDLRRYFNRGPADDHIRREAFECLLEKLNREAEDELRERWPDHVRTKDTSDGDAVASYLSSGSERLVSVDCSCPLPGPKVPESHGFSDDTDHEAGDCMPDDGNDIWVALCGPCAAREPQSFVVKKSALSVCTQKLVIHPLLKQSHICQAQSSLPHGLY